jgi:uncharacterized protein
MRKTLVLGASTNPNRYSYIASLRLKQFGHEIILFGVKSGEINGINIENEWNPNWEIDTVTMYIASEKQSDYYDKIIALKPNRVLFNPGTENKEFGELLLKNGIFSENACTLVLLSLGEY